ncbi:site-specific integrase [Paratractidigestivibacter sp.]|uniref:tyrosine-type recombinase/integrase n=2 Tax=Paratractidigestivibacter sp. TaxID=2847316 RepID=UPI002ACB1909|nr:site-specific integrase [Paratractidigestivibacter sp.]
MTRNYANGCVAKNHGKWLAIITWQEDGKQRRMTKTTGVRCYEDKIDEKTGKVKKNSTGKALAEAVLRAWRDELVAAESAGEEVRGSELTVREYVLSYIEDKERAGTVRDVTTKGYRTALGHLTGTGLGDARMADVTHREIMDWEQGLVEEGLAPATISHIHVFLKQVFAWARKVGDLAGNPFDLVEAPKRVAKPINALPPSEAKRLREALEGFGPSPLATAVGLAMMTGMRQGEICALRWQDVDLEANIIHVNHALTRVSGRFELAAPKTATSRRTIPFGARLKQALVARKESMQADVAEFGGAWDEGQYVIGSALEGTWKNPQVLGKEWHQLARVLGLKGTQGAVPKFHDLRHSFATIMVASGADIKTVSVLLGHADPAMTLRVYADCLEDSKRAQMEKLDGML